MATQNDQFSNVSLQKPTHSSSSQPPDLPPLDQYGELLPQLLSEPRSCQAGWGISWITKAFMLFKDQFLIWLGIGVVYFGLSLVTSVAPGINLIFSLLVFVFIGGVIKGCHAQATGGELKFNYLYSAFSTHLWPLVVLFLLLFLAFMAILIPFSIITGVATYFMGASDMLLSGQFDTGRVLVILVMVFLALLAFIPLVMAIWFAPALIVLHDIRPVKAMKMSFRGCLKNIPAFLVFGIVAPLLMIVIILLTLGFGIFMIIPVGMITYYTSYRDVWTDQPFSVR